MRTQPRRRIVLMLTAGLLLAGTASAAWAVGTPGWRAFETVSPHHIQVQLNAVTAIAPNQAWAVGATGTSPGNIVEHWNGRSWQPMNVPARLLRRPGPLSDVSATSPANVWTFDVSGNWLHFNGSKWTAGHLPVPRNGSLGGLLITSTSVVGRRSIWAFGWAVAAGGWAPYAARLNGATWQRSPVAGPAITSVGFADASVIAPNNIWDLLGGFPPSVNTLVHWNGHRWRTVALPASLVKAAELNSVLALPDGTVWVAGFIPHGSTAADAVVARLTGHSWKIVHLPPARSFPGDYLQQLVPDGAGGMWALGLVACCTNAGPFWHYRDGKWAGPIFVPHTFAGFLHGTQALARVPGTTSVWAVGGEYGAHVPNNEIGVILLYGKPPT